MLAIKGHISHTIHLGILFCVTKSPESSFRPFLFRAHSIFCKELRKPLVTFLDVETAEVMQFLEADGTEEHGLGKVLRQVAGAVHAAGKVDAVGHAEEVTNLGHNDFHYNSAFCLKIIIKKAAIINNY